MTENNRLKILRKELRLTQRELANRIGIRQGNISALEKNKYAISPQIKKLLSMVFNVNILWLETGEENMFLIPQEVETKDFQRQNAEFREKLIKLIEEANQHHMENTELLKRLINILEKK